MAGLVREFPGRLPRRRKVRRVLLGHMGGKDRVEHPSLGRRLLRSHYVAVSAIVITILSQNDMENRAPILIRVHDLPRSLHQHPVLSQLHPFSAMQAEPHSQPPKDRQSTISALNAAIAALDLAEKSSTIPSAKAVFSTVSALLATIRVCFLLSSNDLLRIDTHIGIDGRRTTLRRTWVVLCRCLSSVGSGDERKEVGRARPVRT